MNKVIAYIIALAGIPMLVSCNKSIEKKSAIDLSGFESDYGELAEKYAEMNFETCADAIAAGNEIASILYATSQKAFDENDAKAKSDLEHFGELISAYDFAIDSIKNTCPEEFDNWDKDNRKKINEILQKAEQLSNMHYNDSVWGEDVNPKIDSVNKQVEQLMIDIQQFKEEEDSVNNTNDA